MHPWFALHEEVKIEDLTLPLALKFSQFITRYGHGAATVTGAKRLKGGNELLMLSVCTGRPQRPAYPILREEPVGILFPSTDMYPRVISAREDFPDTPHQNLVPEGTPYSLCIDDRSWREAKITYTPAELLQRIVLWFENAGKGQLHEANQPLDPYFLGVAGTVILPGPVFAQTSEERCDLAVDMVDVTSGTFRLGYCQDINLKNHNKPDVDCVFVTYEIQPDKMSRLRAAPGNLAVLHKEMKMRGVNLLESLATRIRNWFQEEDEWKPIRFKSHLGILLKMPVIHPVNGLTSAHSIIAFITNCSLIDVGVALGCLSKYEEKYGILLPPFQHNIEKIEDIKLDPHNATSSFDTHFAARMAGREESDARKVVMIGAGAIGSFVAETLSREGRFSWVLIDDDVLLPHNLARHALSGWAVGHSKAVALSLQIKSTICSCEASGVVADVMDPGEQADNVREALKVADIIFDASASVPVSRYLCDLPAKARRISFFLNPAGTAVVLMVEDAERAIDLRTIEANFYARILDDPTLADILAVSPARLPYSGNCSAVTTRMPSSRVQILSGLVAQELGKTLDKPCALLKVWQLMDSGAVNVNTYQLEKFTSHTVSEWTVRLSPSMVERIQKRRDGSLPNETGGVLLGVVDVPAMRIDVLGALPPPPDSVEKANGFVRGTDGLEKMVKKSMAQTLDHIRYVGEWHTHPKGCSTQPSAVDLHQLTKLAETLSSDGCPGVQFIAGDMGGTVVLFNRCE